MADPHNTDGAPPRHIHVEDKKKTNWLAWLLLAAGLLALLFALSRCGRDEAAVAPAPSPSPTATATAGAAPGAVAGAVPVAVQRVELPGGQAVELAPATLNYDLQRFLASEQAAPRTFTFDKLNFDTGAAAIRADDRPTLAALGKILTAYPAARVRLVGYADARGSDPANAQLGKQRADAVKQALTGAGIAADRVETASGGEGDPVATNATSEGRFENRRTELVVTAK